MANNSAAEFQPSIKRWLTKTTTVTQQTETTTNSGACAQIHTTNNNKDAETNIFENKIRKHNDKYNAKIKRFGKSDETFKIIITNVNSMINFVKRQKIWTLLKNDPDILLLTDTRIGNHELNYYAGNKRALIAMNTNHLGVAFLVKKCYEPELLEIDNESGNLAATKFKLAGKTHSMIGIYGP